MADLITGQLAWFFKLSLRILYRGTIFIVNLLRYWMLNRNLKG
jgi:hypothetical protein